MLVASRNPCKCGYFPDRSRCHCRERDIRSYLGRISRPLLDRIDLYVEAEPVRYEELTGKGVSECSAYPETGGDGTADSADAVQTGELSL